MYKCWGFFLVKEDSSALVLVYFIFFCLIESTSIFNPFLSNLKIWRVYFIKNISYMHF